MKLVSWEKAKKKILGGDKMTIMDVKELIRELLENEGLEVETYEEAGLLTRNDGLVIKTEDGDEYQVTIVKSK